MNAIQQSDPSATQPLTRRLLAKYYHDANHPYRVFEREFQQFLKPHFTLLDAGCGREAEVLRKYAPGVRRAIGVDLVDFEDTAAGKVELRHADLSATGLAAAEIDLAISRSVMEHLENPFAVYREIHRVLKPDGHFVFLTPNLGDYATIVSKIVPNRLHPLIVARTEGRRENDTFPTHYRSNSARSIGRLARQTGFTVQSVQYLGQYPNYLLFNPALFMLGTAYEKLTSRFAALKHLRGWLLCTLVKR